MLSSESTLSISVFISSSPGAFFVGDFSSASRISGPSSPGARSNIGLFDFWRVKHQEDGGKHRNLEFLAF